MEKIIEKYLLWICLFVLIVPFIALLIPLALCINVYAKGDFWYGYMAYFGTVVLAGVAFWQTNKAYVQNEKLLNTSNSCNVMLRHSVSGIKDIMLSNDNAIKYEGSEKFIFFNMDNQGESFLKKIIIEFPNCEKFVSYLTIAKGDSKNVKIETPKNWNEEGVSSIIFISCNNLETYGDFETTGSEKNSPIVKFKHYHFYGQNSFKGGK